MTDPEVHRHWRWRKAPIAPGGVVVFDIDGVISDASGRQHFLEGSPQDWDSFFAACAGDDLLSDAATMLNVIDPNLGIVLLTARPLWVQPQTLEWLDTHQLRWDLLIMRDHNHWVPSAQFKAENAAMLTAQGYDLRIAFEDDVRNVAAYRNAGTPCVYIHSGYYD